MAHSVLSLASHVPGVLLRRIARHGGAGGFGEPDHLQGAALYFDVSGFTRFTEQVQASGTSGAETVLQVTNAYFGTILQVSARYGGDAVFFAGDSMLLLFEAVDGQGVADAVERAVSSALEIQATVARFEPRPGLTLSMRASVGAGDYVVAEVGGEKGRWLVVVDGSALDQAFRISHASPEGAVVVSREAERELGRLARTVPVPDAPQASRVVSLLRAVPPTALPSAPMADELCATLERYVLQIVAERIQAGLADFIAEFRAVSVLYANLPALSPRHESDRLALQSAVRSVQTEVEHHAGVIREIIRDEKGTNIVVAFGLPPGGSEDSAVRAARCGLRIIRRMQEAGVTFQAGIATGSIFCGEYGTDARRSYSLVGSTVNRAARLMQAAGPGNLICDESTRREGGRRVQFQTLAPASLKGIGQQVPIFRPVDSRRTQSSPGLQTQRLVGRSVELNAMEERLLRLQNHRAGGVVVLQADAGFGKSTLFGHAVEAASRAGVRTLSGAADAIESRTAYFAFRPVFRALFQVDESVPMELRQERVTSRIQDMLADSADLAPLMGVVLPVEFTDNARTEQLDGVIRAENVRTLLSRLLVAAARSEKLVLTIDDAHWLDAASWVLLRDVLQEAPPALVWLATRPLDDPPPEWSEILQYDTTQVLTLGAMQDADIIELLRVRQGVVEIDEVVRTLVLQRAEGHPFFAEEIVNALRDAGVVAIENGRLQARAGGDALRTLDLPGSVTGVITSRIDRLQPAAQLTLKVASVVGRSFERKAVASIHPAQAQYAPEQLNELSQASLIVAESSREPTYAFRHALTHETTYSLMPLAQRRPLHKAAAEYLEQQHARDLSPFFGRLAYHWNEAEVHNKAVSYLALAGEQALAASNLRAGIEYFGRALLIDERLRGVPTVSIERARWHRMLGECHYSLGDYAAAGEHSSRAISYCGLKPPRFGASTLSEAVGVLTRKVRREPVPASGAERERLIEAMRANDLLLTVYLWLGETKGFLHGILQFANVAHATGPCAESARQISILGYLQLMLGMPASAERDLVRAVDMAERAGSQLILTGNLVTLGLFLNALGRHRDALAPLRRGLVLAERLGARLWKHRTMFQLAEALMMDGQVEEAIRVFGDTVQAARGAEFSVVGFANGCRAQCMLWAGRPVQECLELIEGPDGIVLTRDSRAKLQCYAVLGIWMECLIAAGRWTELYALTEEGLSMASTGDECYSFLRGVDGHSGTAHALITLWNRMRVASAGFDGLPSVSVIADKCRQATRNLGKCAKRFPGAKARYLLAKGGVAYCEGKNTAARKLWVEAFNVAESMGLAWEMSETAFHLGRTVQGAERTRWLETSRRVALECGMLRLADRAANPPAIP